MNDFLAFFDRKHKALQKANIEMEICRGNKPCDLKKKKKKRKNS